MSNPLFEQLGGRIVGVQNQNNRNFGPLQRLSELKRNPAAALRNAGYSIPDGLSNPQQILNHLLQSGQIDQGRLAQAQQLARMFRG
jgi:hypothetical protein